MPEQLTHLDEQGRARMVDVGAKAVTARMARAQAVFCARVETIRLLLGGGLAKGDALAAARIAGIQGAKRTSELIPLCHQVPLDSVTIDFEPDENAGRLKIIATARCTYKTGVEMEAFTAATIAALTLYDMAKAVDREASITDVKLLEKSGGKSGTFGT